MDIATLIKESHTTARDKGWWDYQRSFGDQIANFHGEISETFEEFRKHGMDADYFLRVENGKPEGIGVELADVLIRIADTCGAYGIPLVEALKAKLEYNKSRPYRHGGKKA